MARPDRQKLSMALTDEPVSSVPGIASGWVAVAEQSLPVRDKRGAQVYAAFSAPRSSRPMLRP